MNIITITEENLEKEHICCAISSNKDCQVASKKAWISARLKEGLVFKKGDVRGKCFIEYIPAENAWAPILAEGYMYINCLWVSGQFKGHGYSSQLLDECIKDSREKGKKGLVILSSQKKLPYLSDPKYLRHKGFCSADTAAPTYELLYLPFTEDAPIPAFTPNAKTPHTDTQGFVLYYTDQCPFTAKYVPLIETAARARSIPFHLVHLEIASQAQAAPCPFTTYSLFHQGRFLTHEILSEKKFQTLFSDTYPNP